MIIDVILDARDEDKKALTKNEMKDIAEYAEFFGFSSLLAALKASDVQQVRSELKNYCTGQMYDVDNGKLCSYIDSLTLEL